MVDLDKYKKLSVFLFTNGYTVEYYQPGSTTSNKFWRVTGNKIIGGYCTSDVEFPNKSECPPLLARFAADHEDSFRGWSDCPLIIDITDTMDLDFILRNLIFLGSADGKLYKNFKYHNYQLPRVI